jgi:hypothetical protein
MISFGSGDVYLVPPSTASDLTPRKVGEVQEVSLEISQDKVELFGSSKFALMTAVTKAKITGSAKQAKFQGALVSALLGGTVSAGNRQSTSQTMGSAGTTVTATTVTGFEDLGAVDAATGLPLTKVASGATAGQYSVTNVGVYTFGTSGTYTIRYSYTVAGTGNSVLVTNSTMGLAPVFSLSLYNTNPIGEKFGLKLYAATFDKWSMNFKNEEFSMPDMSFSASADSSGNVLSLFTSTTE